MWSKSKTLKTIQEEAGNKRKYRKTKAKEGIWP